MNPNAAPPPEPSRGRYYLIAGIVLVLQVILIRVVPPSADTPLQRPLSTLPAQFDDWTAVRDTPIEPEIARVLQADDTLSRDYFSPSRQVTANLFIAYFGAQRYGRWPHSPQHCMPGAGWQTQSLQLTQVSVPERREPLRINRYVVGRGNERAVLLYWYQSNQRAIATEYLAKIYLVMDSIRYRRSNTSLVRVVLPVPEGTAEAPPAEAGAALIRASFGSIQQLLTP